MHVYECDISAYATIYYRLEAGKMSEPLAFRMRPRTLDDIVGQDDIIGKNTALYKMICKGHVPSMLFYGEPGIGKTSIANAIAGTAKLPFYPLNATTSTKKDVEHVVNEADYYGQVILFLDEIHRFNKLQQDALLPHVENGKIILIGATTENPFHSVNPAIRSRCGDIIQLTRLTAADCKLLITRAIQDETYGLGKEDFIITDEQLDNIAIAAGGDARRALTLIESVFYSGDVKGDTTIATDDAIAHLSKRIGVYGDNKGSHFYNLLSALQKSVRGSDADAALYYLAHLLEIGDLVAVNRRLLVMAYEDIGLANPQIGAQVLASVQAAERLGMPEARIPLANAVISMCLSSKSNTAYKAIDKATHAINSGHVGDIPKHLRDTHYAGAEALEHIGYSYPHLTPMGTFGGWVKQQYLPDEVEGLQFYSPLLAGEEQRLAKIYQGLRDKAK